MRPRTPLRPQGIWKLLSGGKEWEDRGGTGSFSLLKGAGPEPPGHRQSLARDSKTPNRNKEGGGRREGGKKGEEGGREGCWQPWQAGEAEESKMPYKEWGSGN